MAASKPHAQTILEPSYCRLKVTIDDELRDKLQNAKSSLSHLLKSQQLHKMLIAESRLLHISIYKRSAQLRIEKSKQFLKRVKACLQRLHVVGRLFTLVENVNMDISRPLSLQKDETFLPSQQVWTYLLFLASNYFQLLTKTIEYCVIAFDLSCHFASGMLIPTMVLNMGIVARIWQLCRGLQTRIAPFYPVVYSVHCEMKPNMSDWTYPSIPRELSNPVTQMVSQLEEWSSTLTSTSETTFDSVSGEQSASVHGLSDEADRATVAVVPSRLLINESEDLGEIVVSKKRKSERPTFVASKKRKIQPQKSAPTLLQERPTNKTDEPDHKDIKAIHKKKKKKKEKNSAREENVSVSKQTFDTSAIHSKTDGPEKIVKKKLKKKKKIKVSALEKMANGNISNDEVINKLKKNAKQKSKLKKKQLNNNNNDLNLNVGKQNRNVEKKKKKGKSKVAASDFRSSHKKGKTKSKKK